MNRYAFALVSSALLACSAPALADKGSSCHFHGSTPAKEQTVIVCAVQRKDSLSASGKIEASWKTVKHEKIEQIDGKKDKEWKVTFINPQATDKDKRTLYVFLSAPGNVIAANFSGK